MKHLNKKIHNLPKVSDGSVLKPSKWACSVLLRAILVPLMVFQTSSIGKAEVLKPKVLIVQSCQNINIQAKTIDPNWTEVTCDYKLHFQPDGNLVFLKSGQVLWATGTEGRGKVLRMQSDGNLVLYDGDNKPIWATNTNGNPGAFFAIQADGNLVIYKTDGRQAIWTSNTDGGQARTRNAAGEWSNSNQQQASQPSRPLDNLPSIMENCKFKETCDGSGIHTGVDYKQSSGSPVYSICDGTIEHAFRENHPNNGIIRNRFTVIKHENCGGYSLLYSYYGHINPDINPGDIVKRGQLIGHIANWTGNEHLHFGLTDNNLSVNGAWGYQESKNLAETKGWIDPENFAQKAKW